MSARHHSREALSLREAAAILGVSRGRTLRQLIACGSIRTVTIGGAVRIARREIDRVLCEGAPLVATPRRGAGKQRANAAEVAAILALRCRRGTDCR